MCVSQRLYDQARTKVFTADRELEGEEASLTVCMTEAVHCQELSASGIVEAKKM